MFFSYITLVIKCRPISNYTFFAYSADSSANKLLTGWIPILENAVNHANVALCTEECGWNAVYFFDSL